MKLPRRLCRTEAGAYCEETDPYAAFLVGPAGMEMSDVEADRLGITAYYAAQDTAEPVIAVKEVKQSSFEDKSMSGPSTVIPPLAPGVHVDPSARRGGIVTEKK